MFLFEPASCVALRKRKQNKKLILSLSLLFTPEHFRPTHTHTNSIQANGKLENHLKKRKKPEKKLAQDFPGYVGYKDVAYLTEYVTGSDNKSAIENMRNTTLNASGGKEMNVKKKDKKAELNGLKDKKKNGREITTSSSASNGSATSSAAPEKASEQSAVNASGDSNSVSNDLTNDKNNNLTAAAAASSTEIIPNSSSTNHSSASSDSTVRKDSSGEPSGKPVAKDTPVHSESNANNGQPARGNSKPAGAEKSEKSNKTASSNQSRKSSANSEISSSNERQQSGSSSMNSPSQLRSAGKEDNPKSSASSTMPSIVSNGLHGFDSMYIVSDSEVPDQEGDFKIVKYKQLRRKKQKKGSNQEEHIRLTGNRDEQSGRQGGKRDRQRSSAVQNPATARGYESESDYCAVEGRKKGLQRNEMKREVLLDNSGGSSSNCAGATGKKSSFSNSDSDSIHSSNEEAAMNRPTSHLINSDPTPFESASHFAPSTLSNNNVSYSKISYAAITKMHYSNPTSNGAATSMASSNLTSNANPAAGNPTSVANHPTSQQALETRRESATDKKNKNSTNDKNKATQKSITNSAESPKSDEPSAAAKSKENAAKDNRKTPDERKQSQDRQPQDRQPQDRQPAKSRLHKADSNEAAEKASTVDFEFSTTDHSRTDSIDLNHPSFISSKSNSINSMQQPPVIMLDNKSTDQETSFTFGFFNENAQFQNNVDEEPEPSKQFSSVANVKMVNFISKAESASRQPAKSEVPNEKNDEEQPRAEEPSGKPSAKSETTVPNSINLSTIMNSPVGNQPAPAAFGAALNSNALNSNPPICAGTYIMESSEDYSAHDNITKKVGNDAKSSGDQRRSTHINDLVSL